MILNISSLSLKTTVAMRFTEGFPIRIETSMYIFTILICNFCISLRNLLFRNMDDNISTYQSKLFRINYILFLDKKSISQLHFFFFGLLIKERLPAACSDDFTSEFFNNSFMIITPFLSNITGDRLL